MGAQLETCFFLASSKKRRKKVAGGVVRSTGEEIYFRVLKTAGCISVEPCLTKLESLDSVYTLLLFSSCNSYFNHQFTLVKLIITN